MSLKNVKEVLRMIINEEYRKGAMSEDRYNEIMELLA